MKTIKLFKILFLLLVLNINSIGATTKLSLGNKTGVYDKIFKKIGEIRVGVDTETINKLKNPFLIIYKKKLESNTTKKLKIVYVLDGIFENKVKINGKWRNIYSRVGIYKIVKIKRESVILRNTNKTKELFIRKNNGSKIKFSAK